MLEHQHTLTQTVITNVEGGTEGRKRIGAHGPASGEIFNWGGIDRVMLAIVKDDLEKPVSTLGKILLGDVRALCAVVNAFNVKIGRRRQAVLAVALIRCGYIDPRRIFSLVFAEDSVAFIIDRCLQQPLENAGLVGGIRNPTSWALAVNAGDVILGRGAPVHIAIRRSLPS